MKRLVAVGALVAALFASTASADSLVTSGSLITTTLVAQTVTASSAYTIGNAVGGLMTLPSAARLNTGSGLVQSVSEYTASAQTATTDLFLFNANPTGSTCTDKTAFSLAAADLTKVIGVIHITDWPSGGTPSVGQANSLALPFSLPTGTAIYACAVTRGTPTFTATTDVTFSFRIIQN